MLRFLPERTQGAPPHPTPSNKAVGTVHLTVTHGLSDDKSAVALNCSVNPILALACCRVEDVQ